MPLCALSTGTNNAFPELRETTVAGLADGLRRHRPRRARRTACARTRSRSSATAPADLALVDVAVSRERFVGARALWRPQTLRELFVDLRRPRRGRARRRSPAMLRPLARRGGRGLHVRLGRRQRGSTSRSPPGSIARVGVAELPRARARRARRARAAAGSIALDGEREIERGDGERGDRAARRRPAARSTSTR